MMTFDEWYKDKEGKATYNKTACQTVWECAQKEILDSVANTLGDNYGFVNGRFYHKLRDVVKEIT